MKRLIIGVSVALAVVGCSRKYLTVAETDVVLTFGGDRELDYSQYKTYLLPDEIIDLCQEESEFSGIGEKEPLSPGEGGAAGITGCTEADHSLDDDIFAALRKNMDDLGYREVTATEEEPDVAFFLGIVARDNWFVASSSPYCYPYYYYYGCWYPSYSYTYNLPTDTFVIDMADTSTTENGEFDSAWTAILHGLHAASKKKSGTQRVNEAMNQAFEQSDYLADGGEN